MQLAREPARTERTRPTLSCATMREELSVNCKDYCKQESIEIPYHALYSNETNSVIPQQLQNLCIKFLESQCLRNLRRHFPLPTNTSQAPQALVEHVAMSANTTTLLENLLIVERIILHTQSRYTTAKRTCTKRI